jgi:hypothetical protein
VIEAFTRIVHPGSSDETGRLFIKIEWRPHCDMNHDKRSRLSITGVEGPKANGNARGGCGQIVMSGLHVDTYNTQEGWTTAMLNRLAVVWDRWHLNDMRAGTPAQMQWLREREHEYPGYPIDHYTWAKEGLAAAGLQPDNGYSYGSAWLHEEVPDDVLTWLRDLPETNAHPAWV